MVLVFKTNVEVITSADQITSALMAEHPGYSINFALDDIDRILRVEGTNLRSEEIISYLDQKGYSCVELA